MKEEYVYLVKQTQPECNFNDTTIGIYSDMDVAINMARNYNAVYGANCVFDENHDFVERTGVGDPHYYTVGRMKIIGKPLFDYDKADDFMDTVILNMDKKYENDEFEEGYQEAIDYFENEVLNYFDEECPDLRCEVMEWEDDDSIALVAMNQTLCQLGFEYQFISWFEKRWNDSNFLVLVMKRLEHVG